MRQPETRSSSRETEILRKSESSAAKDRGILEDPPFFVRGAGARLWDAQGREYIDFLSGSAVVNAGHGNEAIADAIHEQVRSGVNHVGALLVTPPKAHLIEKIVGLVPRGLTRVHLAITGGEAIEAALKIARQHTKRHNIIAFWGAYHGRPSGGLALTADRAIRDPFFPVSTGVAHFPYPYPFRNAFGLPKDDPDTLLRLTLRYLDAALEDPMSGLGQTAAVFVEPIQGVGGVVVPPRGFLRGLREICDRHGLLLVVDEVFCGFARTGQWFGHQHDEVVPDLMVVSKGLSGALPISAVVGREEIMSRLPGGMQSTTFEGNPIACRAAIASLDFLQSIDAPARARAIGAQVKAWADTLACPIVGEARGAGALWGLELVEPGTTKPAKGLAQEVQREAMTRGLILYRSGHYGNVIGLVPPLVATADDVAAGLRTLKEILEKVPALAA